MHHVEISASRDFIYDWRMLNGVASFTTNNQFLLLLYKLYQLVKGRRHSPNHVDERPSQNNVVAIHVQDQKHCVELCKTHLND